MPCSREALPIGIWNLKKCLGIWAATRAAPTKSGFLICILPGFYVFVVGATLVVAHISRFRRASRKQVTDDTD